MEGWRQRRLGFIGKRKNEEKRKKREEMQEKA
jgi:hypothetical protein